MVTGQVCADESLQHTAARPAAGWLRIEEGEEEYMRLHYHITPCC